MHATFSAKYMNDLNILIMCSEGTDPEALHSANFPASWYILNSRLSYVLNLFVYHFFYSFSLMAL